MTMSENNKKPEKTPNKGGRPPGSPNKTTKQVREVISMIAENQAPELEDWLRRVAEKRPDKAADLYLRMIEYHIPKLSRTEVTGRDGGPIETKHIREEMEEFFGFDGITKEDD